MCTYPIYGPGYQAKHHSSLMCLCITPPSHRQTSLTPHPFSPLSCSFRSLTSAAKHLQSLLLPLTVTAEDSVLRPSESTSYKTREIGHCLQRLARAGHSVAAESQTREKQIAILEALLALLKNGREVLVAVKAKMESYDVSLYHKHYMYM